jgi:hypothetical protein
LFKDGRPHHPKEAQLKRSLIALAATALALAGCGQGPTGGGSDAASREQIRVVGSSTVYPFARAVAERIPPGQPALSPRRSSNRPAPAAA